MKLCDLKIPEFSLSLNLQLIPWDIMYIASINVNEMMVFLYMRVKDHSTFPDRLHPEKPFFDKQMQRIVDCGT